MQTAGLTILPIRDGLLADASLSMYPTQLYGFRQETLDCPRNTSFYLGFVARGLVQLNRGGSLPPVQLCQGMYFGLNGSFQMQSLSPDTQAVCIERMGYRGLASFGGPTEDSGRLNYIDNCRSSLLIHPARLGDPCLNLLTFPAQTLQTSHIHPTIRCGVVMDGAGDCVIPSGEKFPLEPGMAFFIDEGVPHCFHSHDKGMKIIAYHPDTDWGPTDETHPMLNRTYITKNR